MGLECVGAPQIMAFNSEKVLQSLDFQIDLEVNKQFFWRGIADYGLSMLRKRLDSLGEEVDFSTGEKARIY